MGYLATEIIVLLAGAAVIGLIIGWALFGLGKSKGATTTTVAVRDEKTDNELKSERDSRKKAELRILELEARETNFGERLQERDTKIAELMHQLDEQARFRVQSAAQVEERDQKIASLEKALAERPVASAETMAPVMSTAPEPAPGVDPALLAEKDEEIARLTEEAQRLSEEVAALTTGLENLKASDVQHAARVAQLDRENAELRATLVTTANATPTTSEEKDQIIARLNEEVTGLRAAYEAAEQALEEQDAAIDKLTRDLLTAQKKLHAQPEPAPAKAGPTRGGAAAKGSAPAPTPVAAPPLPGPLEAAESTVAVSLDALVAQIDASPAPKSATPPPIPPPLPPAPPKAATQPAPVEASESTVAISLDALVAQIDSGPAKAPPPLPAAAPAPKPAPAVEANESTVAISLDALVAQIDSGPAKASPAPALSPAPPAATPSAPPAPPAAPAKAGFDLSEATVALSLDALVAQIDSGPAKAPAPAPAAPPPKAPPAPEPNESTVAISLDALVAQIEAGAPKAPPPPPAPAPPAAVEANESTVAISLADLVAAVDSEPEVTPLVLDAPPAPAGAFDDLQRIRGIGSNTAKRLNSAGIRTWRQMAALSERDLNQVADLLKISLDKIKREQWVEQARALTGS